MTIRLKGAKWTKELEKLFVKDCDRGLSNWKLANEYGFDAANDPCKSVEAKKTQLRKKGHFIAKVVDEYKYLP